jgi:hypothetical protein
MESKAMAKALKNPNMGDVLAPVEELRARLLARVRLGLRGWVQLVLTDGDQSEAGESEEKQPEPEAENPPEKKKAPAKKANKKKK